MTMNYEYITLEDALVEAVEAAAKLNPRQWELMRSTDYSRRIFGIPCAFAVHCGRGKNGYSYSPVKINGEHRFIYTRLPIAAVERIMKYAGEIGERLFTPEHLADWGYGRPESPEVTASRERAEERARAGSVRKVAENTARKPLRARNGGDFASPNDVKLLLERVMNQSPSLLRMLASETFCREYLGLRGPVLKPTSEVLPLLRVTRDRDDIPYTRARIELDGVSCDIRKLTNEKLRELRVWLSEADSVRRGA